MKWESGYTSRVTSAHHLATHEVLGSCQRLGGRLYATSVTLGALVVRFHGNLMSYSK